MTLLPFLTPTPQKIDSFIGRSSKNFQALRVFEFNEQTKDEFIVFMKKLEDRLLDSILYQNAIIHFN